MTDRTFIWITGKSSRRAHIMNPMTERTYCQTENVKRKKPLDGRGPEKPPGRQLCGNCLDLIERDKTDYQEPRLSVILGERLAEEGPVDPNVSQGKQTDLTSPGQGKLPDIPSQTKATYRKHARIENERRDAYKRERLPRIVRCPKARKPKRSKVKYERPFDDPLPW